MEDSQNKGYLIGGPHSKDNNILGSILGYPNFGKLPYIGFILQSSRKGLDTYKGVDNCPKP